MKTQFPQADKFYTKWNFTINGFFTFLFANDDQKLKNKFTNNISKCHFIVRVIIAEAHYATSCHLRKLFTLSVMTISCLLIRWLKQHEWKNHTQKIVIFELRHYIAFAQMSLTLLMIKIFLGVFILPRCK